MQINDAFFLPWNASLLQAVCPVMVSAGTWCQMRTLLCFSTAWTCVRTWTNPLHTTSSAPHTTHTWQADSLGVNHLWKCIDRCCFLDAGKPQLSIFNFHITGKCTIYNSLIIWNTIVLNTTVLYYDVTIYLKKLQFSKQIIFHHSTSFWISV